MKRVCGSAQLRTPYVVDANSLDQVRLPQPPRGTECFRQLLPGKVSHIQDAAFPALPPPRHSLPCPSLVPLPLPSSDSSLCEDVPRPLPLPGVSCSLL